MRIRIIRQFVICESFVTVINLRHKFQYFLISVDRIVTSILKKIFFAMRTENLTQSVEIK